ncbi:hypothetical protein DdX_05817 [Ditylenchus destructor]|uniref:Uncharacterized protein n=1 Tax=Ditylenchus destructor TaxID=166010 RepID=A0AAD4NBC3_9BILA|nr:hypothetical protein DdX_05817 [Ditylenchus destructor]
MMDLAGTLMKTLRLPKGLNRLLFSGNETVKFLDVMYGMKQPRKNGTDEYACINRCLSEGFELSDDNKTVLCAQTQELVNCVRSCEQRGEILAAYVDSYSETIVKLACHPDDHETINDKLEKETMQCAYKILSDTPKLVRAMKHPLDCYMELEVAADDKAACSSLKQCGVKQTFAALREMCEDELSPEILALFEGMSVYGLTYLSDGRLVNTCPTLYATN